MMTLLCAVCSAAWGQEITYDFTSGWSVSGNSLTNGTSTFTGRGDNFKVNSGYFMMGKNGAYINFPIYDFDVEKIEVVGNSGASAYTKMNIFVDNNAVSTETTGSQGTNTYVIGSNYQTAGTHYTLKVTSNYNAQITSIKIYKKGGDKYYVAGSWTDWQTNKIEMTKNADGTFTLANQGLAAGAEFKIVKVAEGSSDLVWYGGDANDKYWVTIDNHTNISLNGSKNFYIDIAGTWTIIVDPTGSTPTLTVDGWPEWEYYLKGDFNNWEIVDSYKFSEVGAKYTLNKPITLGQKFKIYGIRGSEEKWIGAISDGDFYVEESLVGEELSLTTENGGNNFYMNLSNKKSYWTLEFDPEDMTLVLGNFVSDVAKLPFEFDGGRSAIEGTPGLTTTGLGTDYSGSPYLKFGTANNALILHFDEQPGKLTYDIKGNPASGYSSIVGEFVVQTSADGENYTDLKSYTTLGSTLKSEEFTNLDKNVRYIKWLYKSRTSGNVALGNIKLEKYEAPQPYTLTITKNDNAEIFVFYNDPDNNYPEIENGGEVLANSEVLVSVSAFEGYQIESVTVTDSEGQAVTLTEEEEGISWTFIMPSSNVTVACTVSEIPEPNVEEWVKTDLADLTSDDIFVIVGNNGDNYAMSNDKGTTPPDAVLVVVINDKITTPVTENIKWNISGNATDGYTFYPNGDTEKWLYLKDKSTNKGVYVGAGTADNSVFTLSDGYLYNEATERYVGIYNSDDWRCYTSTSTNIANQTFAFYKRVVPEFTFTIYPRATDGESCYATISNLGKGYFKADENVEVMTVAVVNGKIQLAGPYPIIPGDGAYLVKCAKEKANTYTFYGVKPETEINLNGNNMLYSTGEGNLTATEMAAAPLNEANYKFYKLSLNKSDEANSVGFYWGAANGAAFEYHAGHQAFLAVPQDGSNPSASAYFFDGDATGIYSVNAEVEGTETEDVYSLSGVRMDGKQLPKGIYIVNGKKKVIK